MAEPGDPHSPQDGAPQDGASQGPEDADLFRDEPAPAPISSQRPTWAAPVRPAPEPEEDPHAHDDLIGFTSPASLVGTERPARKPEPEPEPEMIAEPEPAPEPEVTPVPDPESPILAPAFTAPKAEPKAHDTILEPTSSWAVETPLAAETVSPAAYSPVFNRATPAAGGRPTFGRADSKGGAGGEPLEGATGLYTIYALILFAVPTFGVAAVIGLLMVWMRPKPEQPLARSHFEFQTRTLWIAAIAAAVGVVLIAVNLGVFVLVAMAMWVIVRGAWGIMTLAAGKPVANPRTWMI
ncbi:DUF4870 family protein [Brevundimonas goettingensis]|uniref:DUF4870 family protein n=1 Tax=Brevundimonas goettingensis TaxID=2774190 RepID=UPI001CEC6D77|nr:hypothetical protein [Brevundimonas goettingensis]